MSDNTTYSPGQVSEMLGLPPSTLRRYADSYREHLSEHARRRGKKRRYTDTDILILRKIRQLIAQRKTPDEIAAAIQVVDKDASAESTLAMIPQIAQQFDDLRSQLSSLRQDQRAEMEAIQRRLDSLESIVTESRRSFWQRLWDKLFGGG